MASPWAPGVARVRSREGVRRGGSPLLGNLRLDELREQGEGCLPAQIARLSGDDPGYPLLHNAYLRADGDLLQGNRRLYFPGQSRVVELVRVAQACVRYQFEIGATKRVALAAGEIRERHLVGAADRGVHMVHLAREAMRRQPFDQRVRIEERAVDPLRRRPEHPVK